MDTIAEETTFIYRLRDPETFYIRYVGKANDPQLRLKRHLREKSDTHKNRWLKSLAAKGLAPILEIVEEIPVVHWQVRERYWISLYREQGMPLVNGTDGGEGIHGLRHTPEAKAKISASGLGNTYNVGKKQSIETKTKRALSMTGRVVTDDTRKKIGAKHKGKFVSTDTRRKISEAGVGRPMPEGHTAKKRGRKQSPITIAKRSAAMLGNKNAAGAKHSEEVKARRTASRLKTLNSRKKVDSASS